MLRAQTIQVYLPTGDPEGIRVASLTTRTVRVFDIPRLLLPDFMKMNESRQVCIYYLVSAVTGGDTPKCYIGRSEDFSRRVKSHDQKKDFWDRALVAVSLTNEWTVTHTTYMEWLSISRAREAGRYQSDNGNDASKPHTPDPLESDCQEYIETVGLLLATLGVPVLEPVKGNTAKGESAMLYLTTKNYAATGLLTPEGLLVCSGSSGRNALVPSAPESLKTQRSSMEREGVIAASGENFTFLKDYLFTSPSAAATFVTGRHANGRLEWKDSRGRSLNDLESIALGASGYRTGCDTEDG